MKKKFCSYCRKEERLSLHAICGECVLKKIRHEWSGGKRFCACCGGEFSGVELSVRGNCSSCVKKRRQELGFNMGKKNRKSDLQEVN